MTEREEDVRGERMTERKTTIERKFNDGQVRHNSGGNMATADKNNDRVEA